MYIFNRLSLIFISITRNEYQKLQLQIINKRFDIEGILGIEVGYISNYFREIFNFVLDSYICNAFNSYLELSSYISGVIFFVGLLLTFIGWFWLTATLLGLIWLDFVKSTSATFFFSFLIIRKTYLNIGLFLIIPILLFFLIIFAFYYYSIQVVYSLYLVQLAGGRGDEYLSYFRLRRMIQNNTKQNTRFTERTYGDKNKSNETSSLIREHDAETNV
ncbi:hypothetical protein FG379_000684 [Cryptosporidium bovis]|uniref:uncharacterized protein n=1 Tax=Cryptosporidium bovis TaxID=310047 RepID=UPI00351A408D|nr:hypothetical protein FG379_000684 [Cryptosporidium bovis]